MSGSSLSLRFRAVVVAFVLVCCGALGLYPMVARRFGIERPRWLVARALKLGLDLQGGVDLVVGVQSDVALQRETENAIERLLDALSGAHVPPPAIERDGAIAFTLAPQGSHAPAEHIWPMLDATFTRSLDVTGTWRFVMRPEAAAAVREDAVEQARQTIERRVNELGVSEPVISRQLQRNAIEIQLPGVTDVDRARTLLQATGLLEFTIVDEGPSASPDAWTRDGRLPDGTRVVAMEDRGTASAQGTAYYLVTSRASVTGADLRGARPTLDQNGRPAVAFSLTADGARRFGAMTAANIGRALAVVLDGKAASIARIEGEIHAEGQIAGSFSSAEAQNLAVILRSGSLKAPITYLSEHVVSATLGADAVRAGVLASGASVAAVAAFMVAYYRLAGVNAILSMTANLVILLGLMAYMGAVMTLPGIAGFVLTIGIGVDSNVLVFERIKEEIEQQRGVRAAIQSGYSRVFRTLLDTHVAALIAAGFLFQFGTGPIKGFAATLAAGLVSNLFTSTFVSRTIFDLSLRGRRVERLSI